MQAVFWLAPGVMLRDDIAVQEPPPLTLTLAIKEPEAMSWATAQLSPIARVRVQEAEFRLLDGYRVGQERAHYRLATSPPSGWAWLAVGKTLRCERRSTPPTSEAP